VTKNLQTADSKALHLHTEVGTVTATTCHRLTQGTPRKGSLGGINQHLIKLVDKFPFCCCAVVPPFSDHDVGR